MSQLVQPHRRYNPLTGQWILVSPHRTQRPWQGKQETVTGPDRPAHDPDCYLCAGNARAGGQRNSQYTDTFVFDNDYPALLAASGEATSDTDDPLFQSSPVEGTCRVICFSPRHDLTLPRMSVKAIRRVVDVWADQTTELGERFRWVQVFENKGAVMGCSNPHPHGQIWASDQLPEIPAAEDVCQTKYFKQHGRPLLLDYGDRETDYGTRVVVESDHWIAVVPYWATWPFETLLLPRRHVGRMDDLNADERDDLADTLKALLTRYDNLFETSFPYSMGWHQTPFLQSDTSHWQLHAHFFPPLLRSATVKKFMVGYEMLAEPQRDLTPEQAAAQLRETPQQHYLDAKAASL
jgi:UDPglucose--hexose-1-phosphate uridylyltransferase